jgi:hypothetical protein
MARRLPRLTNQCAATAPDRQQPPSGAAGGARHIQIMIEHRYPAGAHVRLLRGALDGEIPDGVYTISRTLPVEGATCRYRLRHDTDGHERVVREEQIAAVA